MKKHIYKIITIVMIFVLLGISATAYTGYFDNYSSPRQIVIPAAYGCGDNVIGLYVTEYLYNFSANHTSKYKWLTWDDDEDIQHACEAIKINVTNILVVDTDFGSEMSQKTAQFYGDDMTTSMYQSISNNSVVTSELITNADYSYITVVREPFYNYVIQSDAYYHDIP